MDTTKFPDVVELNIGGKLITTLLSTLTKDPESMLAAMFSGRHVISKDKNGRFFIDCDGNMFEYILNFLRFGTLPPKEKALEMYDVAVYFNLQPLSRSLECYRSVQYRRGIKEMKKGLDIQVYERLKKDALRQLNKCCARPEDNIIVAFMFQGGSLCSADCVGPTVGESANTKFIHIISLNYVSRDSKIKKLITTCIAHDIYELGYGKYIYNNKPARLSFVCEHCRRSGSCNESALLVAYKIIEIATNRQFNRNEYV